MKIRITFEEIETNPEVEIEIPDDSRCIKYAEKARADVEKLAKEKNKVIDTWDLVDVFEQAIAEYLASGISVDIIGL